MRSLLESASRLKAHKVVLAIAGVLWCLGWVVVPSEARLAWGVLGGVSTYFILLEVIRRRRRQNASRNDWLVLLEGAVLLLVLPALVIGFVGDRITGDPIGNLPLEARAHALLRAGEPMMAEGELARRVKEHPEDIPAHRLRMYAHFQVPKYIAKHHERNDTTIREEYENWAEMHRPGLAPIGPLALGMYYRFLHDPERALLELGKVPSSDLTEIEFERGCCLEELGRYTEAVGAFRRVANVDKGNRAAISHLVRNHANLGDYGELKRIYSEVPQTREFTQETYRKFLFHEGHWGDYVGELLFNKPEGFIPWFLAGITFLLWFAAIRFWDRYESEPLWIALGTVALGAGMSQFVFVVDDLRAQLFAAGLGHGVFSDLAYCVVGIGLVEESIKWLPVGLVHRFTRHINEPVDWGIYGAYSALGFAISENVLYHQGIGSGTVMPRAMLSVPFHLCLTAMTGIVFFEARRIGIRRIPAFTAALGLSAVIHGLYDFWIVGPWEGLGIVAFFIATWLLIGFKYSLEQILARSPFRKGAVSETYPGGRWFLLGFFLLLMVTFAVRIGEVGATRAWPQLLALTLLNGLSLGYLYLLGSLMIPVEPKPLVPKGVHEFLKRRGWLEVK